MVESIALAEIGGGKVVVIIGEQIAVAVATVAEVKVKVRQW